MMKLTVVTLLLLITANPSRSGVNPSDYNHEIFKPIDSIISMKTNQNIRKLDAAISQLHVVSLQYDSIKRMMTDSKID